MSTRPDDLSTYGPSALATPANAITVLRLLLSPLVFGLIVAKPVSWITFSAWVGLVLTDGLDGWVARRQGRTRSGAFLDPLADKVLVLGGLMALVSVGRFWWVPVAMIASREITISLYRSYWGHQGIAVPAIGIAKVKTAFQSIAIALAVFPLVADSSLSWSADAVLWVSVGLTLWSGAAYLIAGRRATTAMQP
jgi:CDP-diacylglycerol--glycerol-3-phosphate 3-phosphatidyltransferase